MGRVAEVIAVDDGEIKVDEADPSTVDHYADPGDDSLPLPGDFAALEETTGQGLEQAAGYHAEDAEKKAAPGEKRIYARALDRTLVGEIWLKRDGTIVIKSVAAESGGEITLAPSGVITMNGVTIDPDGNIATPGDIGAQGTVTGTTDVVAGAIALKAHVHISAAPASPTGGPIAPPPP